MRPPALRVFFTTLPLRVFLTTAGTGCSFTSLSSPSASPSRSAAAPASASAFFCFSAILPAFWREAIVPRSFSMQTAWGRVMDGPEGVAFWSSRYESGDSQRRSYDKSRTNTRIITLKTRLYCYLHVACAFDVAFREAFCDIWIHRNLYLHFSIGKGPWAHSRHISKAPALPLN